MPSPRSSSVVPPSSPLAPGYKASTSFQPPSPLTMHARPSVHGKHHMNAGPLRLPSLPRFHPANFPSAQSSVHSTHDGPQPPPPPASLLAHQRVYSDAQKHLLLYRREMMSAARAPTPAEHEKPQSPRLEPLGSPGPVTPLELERHDGYVVAGARKSGNESGSSNELVDKLIREEARRRRGDAWTSTRPSGWA